MGRLSFSVIIFLPFHTVYGVLKVRMLKWFAIPFTEDQVLPELSTMTRMSTEWVVKKEEAYYCIFSTLSFSPYTKEHLQPPITVHSWLPSDDTGQL